MSQLLVELADKERAGARPLLDACETVELRPGVSVSAAELPAAALFVVERGVVVLASSDGRRMVVAIATPGDVLAQPGKRQEFRALRRAGVTAVTEDALRRLLLDPGVTRAIIAALLKAVFDREESLDNFARFPHAEGVRGKLLQLARSHGKVTKEGIAIDLPLTQDLLAESVGSTRETVTLAVRDLIRSGLLSRHAGRYRLHVPPEELIASGRPTVRNLTEGATRVDGIRIAR